MTAVTIIVDLVLIVVSIILIITVLMQQGQRQGLGAIGGGAETFFGKNKAKSYEGKLATLTKVCAVVFIVLAMVATIVTGNESNNEIVIDDTSVAATDETTEADTTDVTEDAAETGDEAADVTDDEAAEETPAEETADDTTEESEATEESETTEGTEE